MKIKRLSAQSRLLFPLSFLLTPASLLLSPIFYLLLTLMLFFGIQSKAQDTIPENILLHQRNDGSWHKNMKGGYTKPLSDSEKTVLISEKSKDDGTIDNNATTHEIKFLVQTYQATKNPVYLAAAEKGIQYLLNAQYANGGWPQYYPDKKFYRHCITYNDNAMVNVLRLLSDLVNRRYGYDAVNPKFTKLANDAIARGIDCILKTQILVHGKRTAWCAQHDEITLQPANARAYELISISGSESVGIVEYLMQIPHPSTTIKNSINSAVAWFSAVKIPGYAFVKKDGDKVVIPDANSTIWARFYDIETNEPFFCGRDGEKKKLFTDIERERRNGYAWYGNWPQKLLEKEYPTWLAMHP